MTATPARSRYKGMPPIDGPKAGDVVDVAATVTFTEVELIPTALSFTVRVTLYDPLVAHE